MALLSQAGVDMTTREPLDMTMRAMIRVMAFPSLAGAGPSGLLD